VLRYGERMQLVDHQAPLTVRRNRRFVATVGRLLRVDNGFWGSAVARPIARFVRCLASKVTTSASFQSTAVTAAHTI
jgi:hypothetical protein